MVLCFLLLFCLNIPAGASSSSSDLNPNKKWLKKELTKLGVSRGFIRDAMETYEEDSFSKVLTMNLLGFLRPPGEHMDRVTPEAVKETAKFIDENEDTFDLAEQRYRVPPDVIAALLWIETRHGEDMGDFHTLSVFLHLYQANRPENRRELTRLALEKNKEEQSYTPKALRKLMRERTKKKAQWAEEQIIAMAAIRKEKHLDLKNLRGSYAGAFGFPQFIPSSYQAYARAAKKGHAPDLTKPDDAIMSVAFYLYQSGWRNHRQKSKVAALMKYNNSRDYADAILEISKRATADSSSDKARGISSTDGGG